MQIDLSNEACEDLDQIFDHILADSPQMAQVVLDRIQAGIARLAETPHIGRPGRVPGTRELVVPKTPFIVPYQVVGETVEVLRVYHGARLWPEAF